MNVSIRVGAGLELGTGMARLSVTLTEDATVADLLEYLRAQYPDASRLESVVLVSNGLLRPCRLDKRSRYSCPSRAGR
jgi:hypothetical protein